MAFAPVEEKPYEQYFSILHQATSDYVAQLKNSHSCESYFGGKIQFQVN